MNEYELARNKVISMLSGETQITSENIRDYVRIVVQSLKLLGRISKDIDQDILVKDIETCYNVWIGEETVIDERNDHIDWLPENRSKIQWRFSKRHERFLLEEKGWSQQMVDRLSNLTDKILERLEDPFREGVWDRRGMVVGQVQSGKTANYISLVCKAVDAGYKLIVVMAGMHNSLRSQTQLRFDEAFLGFDTQRNRAYNQGNPRIGVGKLIGEDFLIANSLTSSAEIGDFNTRIANQVGVFPGGSDPILLVIKKNHSVLRNLLNWAIEVRGIVDPKTNKRILRNIPLLVIDDEADYASVNTNPVPLNEFGEQLADYDVSRINGQIRQLLSSFEKSAYVGYTATPFANIFIHPAGETESHGEDLFPRDFIINLPAPSNYVGPVKVFGLLEEEQEAIEGLPVIRVVDDYYQFVPDRHRKTHVPSEVPASLKNALKSFILSCAVRIARGQDQKHNSMLIHVTRYNAIQEMIGEQVQEEVNYLKRRIEYGDETILAELENLWFSDYTVTTQAVMQKVNDPRIFELDWKDVEKNLILAVSKIEVRIVNGSVGDVLNYIEHPMGLNVIVIGGDKLSRGLTLEGLSVSYYLRSSRMYDTLMQMGRWFGYRPGYVDLCRLYISRELVEWYRFITMASEELRDEFDYMAKQGATPEEYGLRVRTHPENLLVTSVNKMRSGTEMLLSFSNSIIETVVFHKNKQIISNNFNLIDRFLCERGTFQKVRGNYIWSGVSYEEITKFLGSNFRVHPDSKKADLYRLKQYVELQTKNNNLIQWTVALISNSRTSKKCNIGREQIGLTLRNPSDKSTEEKYFLRKNRLIDPHDESIDLSAEQIQEAESKFKESNNSAKTLSGPYIRSARDSKNGLMLIYLIDPKPVMDSEIPFVGIAFSIPTIKNDRKIRYLVNNVYWEQEFGYV